MTGSIYLLGGDGQLEPMDEQPYDSENLLQELLASHPDLLAGDQIDPEAPRRWLLVRREAGIPDAEDAGDRWAVDHLFLDQDAVPTLVEVKRSADSRIRREVVGQMLDYAANAVVHWPVERVRAAFEAECSMRGADAEAILADFLGAEEEPEAFWAAVKTNLQAGRIRMVFVSDAMPSELVRIVEFLNEQMDPAEILAVEVRQYVGSERRTLVPRVVGQTAQARRRKDPGGPGRQWDEASVLQELRNQHGAEAERVARELIAWGRRQGLRLWHGSGRTMGSIHFQADVHGVKNWTFALWTYGTVELQFQHLKERGPFAPEERRLELARKLDAIPGIEVPADSISRRPPIPILALASDEARRRFLEIFDEYLEELRATPPGL